MLHVFCSGELIFFDIAGEWFSSAGANFTPHIVTVNAGEVKEFK